MTITIRQAVSRADLEKCRDVRTRVFGGEQNVSREIDFDGKDETAFHALAEENGVAIGTVRMVDENGVARIGRLCVLKGYRGKGIGKKLMQEIESIAVKNGFSTSMLHAQTHALDFYKNLGYVEEGPRFFEAEIEHITMTKKLLG